MSLRAGFSFFRLTNQLANCPLTLTGVLSAHYFKSVFRLRRYDHVTDALAILHWLRLPERVSFKLALMAYRVLHGMAPVYLNQLVPLSDLPSRRRLRSSSTLQLLVPPYRLTTVSAVARFRLQPPSSMEHFTCPCPVISIYLHLPSAAKDILVSSIISWHYYLNLLHYAPAS